MSLERWELDSDHSSLQIAVRHMGISWVRGRFTRWGGTLFRDVRDGKLQVDIQINLASLDTGSKERDEHLKGPGFLDVAHFPYATFVADRAENVGARKYLVIGELTLRGQSHAAALEVEHSEEVWDGLGTRHFGFECRATVERKDYGIEAETMLMGSGLVIGQQIEVTIEAEATRSRAPVMEELRESVEERRDRG